MVEVEVCINSDCIQNVGDSVKSAVLGGASRIELCSAMHYDGLTPKAERVIEARNSLEGQVSLMVMIRPRPGDFIYSKEEIREMHNQIKIASDAGADGVAFGVLKKHDSCLDLISLNKLMQVSANYNLKTTFHRAFDAIPNQLEALDILIDLGIDRILTSGTKWGQNKTALNGINILKQIIDKAEDRIEVVIGGGINSGNVGFILNNFPLNYNKISVHAYSGAQINGLTSAQAVRLLVKTVKEVAI